MEWKYWKVVLRYGHIGKRKDVMIARYLVTPSNYNSIMVMDVGTDMPGVKNRGIMEVKEVELEEFLTGKRGEVENFYLQKLFVHKEWA